MIDPTNAAKASYPIVICAGVIGGIIWLAAANAPDPSVAPAAAKIEAAAVVQAAPDPAPVPRNKLTPGERAIVDRIADAEIELRATSVDQAVRSCIGNPRHDACRALLQAIGEWCARYPGDKECRR